MENVPTSVVVTSGFNVPTSVVVTSGFAICTFVCCSYLWICNMYLLLLYLLLDLSYVPSSDVVTSLVTAKTKIPSSKSPEVTNTGHNFFRFDLQISLIRTRHVQKIIF